MAPAGAAPKPETMARAAVAVEFGAVIQLTGIFDQRIIPRLVARQVSGCSAAW
jgi:hypothetical protein